LVFWFTHTKTPKTYSKYTRVLSRKHNPNIYPKRKKGNPEIMAQVQAAELKDRLKRWSKRLAASSSLALPTDYPRPSKYIMYGL
jgi:hypothetical protein